MGFAGLDGWSSGKRRSETPTAYQVGVYSVRRSDDDRLTDLAAWRDEIRPGPDYGVNIRGMSIRGAGIRLCEQLTHPIAIRILSGHGWCVTVTGKIRRSRVRLAYHGCDFGPANGPDRSGAPEQRYGAGKALPDETRNAIISSFRSAGYVLSKIAAILTGYANVDVKIKDCGPPLRRLLRN